MPPLAAVPVFVLHRHPPFALAWGARACATAAFQMQGVAVGWQVYDLTGSALALGLVGLTQFLPLPLLALAIGHVADRYDRRVVVRLCMAVEALAALALALGGATGRLTFAGILAIVFVSGAARAFESPTLQALVPTLVPAPVIPRAVAAATSANQVAVILGPALGGFIYAAGPGVAYAACAAAFLLASALVAAIRIALPAGERRPASLSTVLAGVVFVRRQRVLLGLISLDLFAVLLGESTALLPIFARDILATGPWGLGLLRGAPALGAVATALFLARYPIRRRTGRAMLAAVALFGGATIGFALSTSFLLSLAILGLMGAANAVNVVIRHSIVQTRTPNEMRGRVSTISAMSTGTSNRLGEFESGVVAAWVGAVPSVLIGGIGTLVIVLAWMRLFPEIARIDALGSEEPSA
ncbi:MAG: MFS transporter [Candidatus Lambdaproteobacteria bacterium]|nr:MFS transporter [Candidatus Lambdaproteobacteria bacterium]